MSDKGPFNSTEHVEAFVAHAFRRWHAQLVAALVRSLGPRHLDTAEESVQDAMLSAFETWSYRGVPDRPDAWLYTVARRKALDRLAREATRDRVADSFQHGAPIDGEALLPAMWSRSTSEMPDPDALGDDELTMLFLCAHPSLTVEVQITLMLRTVCGLGVPEIAQALLTSVPTIAQRLVRAKRQLAQLTTPFALPSPSECIARIDAVLRAVYLLFNEGYSASQGETAIRHELCTEAVRLVEALANNAIGEQPRVYALCALLRFQSSRLKARERDDGVPIPLDEQDRALWDRSAIARGWYWMERAATGDIASDYHLQAGIAAEHAIASSADATNWPCIRTYYEQLLERTSSPIVRLNYAVAIAHTDGPDVALSLLSQLENTRALEHNHLVPAMQARWLTQIGDTVNAAIYTRRALQLVRTAADRALLSARLTALAPETVEMSAMRSEDAGYTLRGDGPPTE